MHFLPWIFSLLLIYALVSGFILDQHKTTSLSSIALNEAIHLKQKINEKKIKAQFLAATKNKAKKQSTDQKKEKDPSEKSYISHRLTNYRNSTAKIHLLSFLNSEDPQRLEVLKRCFETFYSSLTPFSEYKGDFSREMAYALDHRCKILTTSKKNVSWIDLIPEDANLAKLYLLMLEGCPAYSFQRSDLFPALEEIFFINPSQKILGFFPDLPYPTLSCLFSKNFADELMALEKKQFSEAGKSLPKEQVIDLLKQHGFILPDLAIFQFQGKPMPSREIVVHDLPHRMTYTYTP